MKRYLFIIISSVFLLCPFSSAKTLNGGVELDWPLLNQDQRDRLIENYRQILFENVKQKIDKEHLKEKYKDSNFKENYAAIKSKWFDLGDRKLAGFYMFGKILAIYGVKYESDKYRTYYYTALGGLKYVDILDKPYDEFPHKAYQYDKKGKLKGVSYHFSDYDQIVFKANGKFYCRWYNDKCYDKKAKMIMTRKIAK